MKIRFVIGIIFLALQLGSITYARFTPERFFCWAPYDTHVKFEVFVSINGKTLNPEEIEARYKYKTKGWEQRSIHNILSIISQYEHTYGKADNAQVTVHYSINGHKQQKWTFAHD